MAADERELMRRAIMGNGESQAEFDSRFAAQMESILSPRLSVAGRITRGVLAVLLAAAAFCCVFMFAFVVFLGGISTGTYRALTPQYQAFLYVTHAAAFLFCAAGAVHCVFELLKGRAAPRRLQQISAALRYGALFAIGFPILPLVWANQGPRPAAFRGEILSSLHFIFITHGVAFFLMALSGFLALNRILRWHREDILLEVKRTQLDMAIMREELAKKPGGTE